MLADYEAPPIDPGDRRGAARLHRPAQGGDARLGGLMALLSGRRRSRFGCARGAGGRPEPIRSSSSCRSRTCPTRSRTCRPARCVSVTASPAKGIDATLDWAAQTPDRRVPRRPAPVGADDPGSGEAGRSCSARAAEAAITRAFVVGGDADEPGEYLDGLSLLEAMREMGHPFETIGCPGYPQGHAGHPGRGAGQRAP